MAFTKAQAFVVQVMRSGRKVFRSGGFGELMAEDRAQTDMVIQDKRGDRIYAKSITIDCLLRDKVIQPAKGFNEYELSPDWVSAEAGRLDRKRKRMEAKFDKAEAKRRAAANAGA